VGRKKKKNEEEKEGSRLVVLTYWRERETIKLQLAASTRRTRELKENCWARGGAGRKGKKLARITKKKLTSLIVKRC
jgi:hypothetical protein